MKHLKDYITESAKLYSFRIKLACEPSNEQMECLKLAMQKFGLKSITGPKKTILQKNPMDFQNLSNVEVFIVDSIVTYPSTPQVLEQYIASTLKFPQSHVRVLNSDNPNEAIVDSVLERSAEIAKEMSPEEKIKSARLMDPDYKDSPKVDHSKYYGDAYNQELVKKAKESLKDRTTVEYAKKPEHEFGPMDFIKNLGNTKSPVGSKQNNIPDVSRKR